MTTHPDQKSYVQTHLHALNPAEGILFPFFDRKMLRPEGMQVYSAPGVSWDQGLHWLSFSWSAQKQEETLLSLTTTCDIDISEFDRAFVHGSFPDRLRVEMILVVDGEERTVIRESLQHAREAEFEAPVSGKKLTKATIRLIPEITMTTSTTGWLFIAGFAHAAKREALYEPAFPNDWYESVKDRLEDINCEQSLGVWFDDDQLKQARQNAVSDTYQPLMERLRNDANACMTESIPERMHFATESRALQKNYMFARPHEATYWRGLVYPSRICAFVGMLDSNPEMLQYAARCAMAMATRTDWSWGLYRTPGASWFGVPGQRAQMLLATMEVLDWAGSAFTKRGVNKCWDTAMQHGVGHLLNCMTESEWLYTHNHGINGAVTLCLAGLALAKRSPRGKWLLDIAEGMLAETVQRVVLEDGATEEGPGYWGGVMAQLGILIPLARYHGLSIREYIEKMNWPLGLLKTHEYLLTFLSNDQSVPAGTYLPFSDSGWIMKALGRPEALSVVAAISNDPRMQALHTRRIKNIAQDFEGASSGPQSLFLVPPTTDDIAVFSPEFHVLPKHGTLTSRRESALGSIRLNLFGWQGNSFGHAHEDKGSIILEVDGECLLIDPGVTIYNDPRTPLLKCADHHNLLVPLDSDGEALHQNINCHAPILATGTQVGTHLQAKIDITQAWEGQCLSNHRSIESKDPTHFVMHDEMSFETPTAAVLCFQSHFPIVRDAKGWIIQGTKAAGRIQPTWDVEDNGSGVDTETIDYNGDPVHRLRLYCKASTCHSLKTELTIISPDAASSTTH